MEERLQKVLSAAGICSRRAAEEYITAGRVTVNGEVAALGRRADPERDDIRLITQPVHFQIHKIKSFSVHGVTECKPRNDHIDYLVSGVELYCTRAGLNQ